MIPTREDLWGMPVSELARVLASGHAIDPGALVGRDYRGTSLGLPSFLIELTWRSFRKVFRADGGRVVGHNVRLTQTGFTGPSVPVLSAGREQVFGPYEVLPLSPGRDPFGCQRGLLLDYGKAHPAYHPLSRVRDPLVALAEGNTELLLGATYLDLWGRSLRTPSFFTLELERP